MDTSNVITPPVIAAMIGAWEIVLILFVLGFPVAIVGVVLFIVKLSRRNRTQGGPHDQTVRIKHGMSAPADSFSRPHATITSEHRLSELKHLLNSGLISPEDYEKKKADILSGL